ncbi:MAG: DUF5691 domain-containing protein [Meiothermus sp.]|nr:DUF5691 domain-containing protein [Meiothermus sp.]
MSVNDYWKALTATALLGTERQAVPRAAGIAIESVLRDESSKEEALLSAAAAASLYRRSGRVLPQSSHPLPPVALPDRWRELTPSQHTCFEAVMQPGSEKKDLMGELFRLMVQAQVRPYRGWVYRVLEEAHSNAELRPDALLILGERGRWMAQFVSFGQWVTPTELTHTHWEEGRLEERLAYLQQVRNAEPGRARALVEEVWAGESHEVKVRLLEVLQTRLSLEDEPFLESCLDEKRKEVRLQAANLLNQLPQSRLVQRMGARARPLLLFTPVGMRGLKKARLEVVLPEQFEKDWPRDGIEQKSVPYGMGEKAWWLQQIVERVPPSWWGEPEQWIPSPDKEWRDVLRKAWLNATLRFKDAHWATVLMAHLDDHNAAALIAVLAKAEVEAQTLHRLNSRTTPLNSEGLEWQFLQRCPKPLSAEVAQALSKRALQSLSTWQKMEKMDWRVNQVLSELALMLPPAFVQQILPGQREAFARPEHPLLEAFAKFVEVLEFRQQMHQAFGLSGATR